MLMLPALMSKAVSTHSHPKVAGIAPVHGIKHQPVSTHSHPKVAGRL